MSREPELSRRDICQTCSQSLLRIFHRHPAARTDRDLVTGRECFVVGQIDSHKHVELEYCSFKSSPPYFGDQHSFYGGEYHMFFVTVDPRNQKGYFTADYQIVLAGCNKFPYFLPHTNQIRNSQQRYNACRVQAVAPPYYGWEQYGITSMLKKDQDTLGKRKIRRNAKPVAVDCMVLPPSPHIRYVSGSVGISLSRLIHPFLRALTSLTILQATNLQPRQTPFLPQFEDYNISGRRSREEYSSAVKQGTQICGKGTPLRVRQLQD